jgi:hypothetical protein
MTKHHKIKSQRKRGETIKKVTIKKKYQIVNDSESNIPLNKYSPELLPIPDNYRIDNIKQKHYFELSQTESADEFHASVRPRRDGAEILVGGEKTRGCIIIHISKVDLSNPNSIVEAFLNVKYNEHCNVTNDLAKGIGTIILMRTAMSFAFTYFKIDKFILKDVSKFACDTQYISLPALYILKYGKSWYQKHINARTYNEQLHRNIEKYKLFVDSKPDWDYLYNTFILPDVQSCDKCDEEMILRALPLLHDTWKRTDNYRDFILDIISKDEQCVYLMGWFDDIFHDIVDEVFYGQVDNFLLYNEFPFIKGLNVEYMKTTRVINEKDDNLKIRALQLNEEYTVGNTGLEVDKLLFNKIMFRRRDPDS